MARSFFIRFFSVLALISLSSPVRAEQDLVFVSVDAFPPYTWTKEGEPTGIDVEIVQSLAERTDLPIIVELVPGKRLLRMVQDGTAAGGFAAFKTTERETYALFLEPPIHYSVYRLYVRKGEEFPFRNVEDLKGKFIGKNSGFHISSAFSSARDNKLIQVIDVKSMEQSIKMLIAGRLDAFVGNEQEVSYTLKNMGLSGEVASLSVPVRDRKGGHLMISKAGMIADRRDILDQISQALQEMSTDGTFESIYEKYRD